jgi:hypothetical protein
MHASVRVVGLSHTTVAMARQKGEGAASGLNTCDTTVS